MNIIDIARSNYLRGAALDESSLPPDSDNRWPAFRRELAKAIGGYTNHLQAVHHAQSLGIYDHRQAAAGREQQLLLYRHVLNYEYPHFAHLIDAFSDSPHSLPLTLAQLDGKTRVSNVMYFDMFYILTCLTYRSELSRVCEIGGGYGGPARLWLTNPIRSIENYTIIDLPESLFFAECFLRASLPDHDVVYCHSKADCINSKPRTIYLVPHANAGLTNDMEFDLVCNTGSIGELSDDWALFWASWLARQHCTAFYSHNYFGTRIDKLYEGRSILSPRVPSGWRVAYLRINAPLMILQSTDRNAVELILVKSNTGTRRDWIYDIQRIQEPEAVGLRELAYYIFNLPEPGDADIHAELQFLQKCLSSFRYLPKELLYLSNRILTSRSFNTLDDAPRNIVVALQAQLESKYRENYPKGHSAA